MAEFSRHADVSMQNPAVRNDAAPNSRTECQQYQIVHVLACADPLFTKFLQAGAALLFYPTRILRRKNIELALEVLAACRHLKYPAKLIVSGAVNPHGPGDRTYLNELKQKAKDLQGPSTPTALKR